MATLLNASKTCSVAEPDWLPPSPVQDITSNNQEAEDYDFVEEPDQDYFCPVSLELLLAPHQTLCCGHHISQQAANRLIRERKPCPMCKENLATQVDKYFKRKVNQLKVRCPHKQSGCDWVGELGDLNLHSTSCPKRPWKCQHCDFESTYEVGTNEHTPNCAQYPLPCPNQCEIGTVPRCDAEKHLLVCPLQLVECEFAHAGCDVKIPRRDLTKHMTENAQHHLMSATLLNLRLTRELHQKMEEKDQQVAELQQQISDVHKDHTKLSQYMSAVFGFVRYEITFPEFDKLERDEEYEWSSETMCYQGEKGGIKFKMRIEGNNPSIVSFYASASSSYSSIECTIILELLNQRQDRHHFIVKKSITLSGSVSEDEEDNSNEEDFFDFEESFASLPPAKELKYNAKQNIEYLRNNTLKFRVYIALDNHCFVDFSRDSDDDDDEEEKDDDDDIKLLTAELAPK